MKIACYTDIHNQQTMLNIPATLRKSAVNAVELTKKEWGQVDVTLVGGDNVSDYPYWNKSCALPYENWLDIKKKMVDCFASVTKDEKVLYVDGNNDLILGDLPTKNNPPYNTCDFYFTGPMKDTLGVLEEKDYIAKYAKSKGEQAGLHFLAFHYVIDGIDFFGINIDPDSAFNSHDGYYDERALLWLGDKLKEVDPEGNKLIFVVGHLSATTVVNEEKISESMREDKSKELYNALVGHRNLFYMYGHVHGQGYVHSKGVTGVLHFDTDTNLIPVNFDADNSKDVIGDKEVGFHTVHMGGLRPFYAVKDGVNLYFEEDIVEGKVIGDREGVIYASTATPKLAQYLVAETYDDRVVFHYRNTGSFKGFSTDDIPEPYTVFLKK